MHDRTDGLGGVRLSGPRFPRWLGSARSRWFGIVRPSLAEHAGATIFGTGLGQTWRWTHGVRTWMVGGEGEGGASRLGLAGQIG